MTPKTTKKDAIKNNSKRPPLPPSSFSTTEGSPEVNAEDWAADHTPAAQDEAVAVDDIQQNKKKSEGKDEAPKEPVLTPDQQRIVTLEAINDDLSDRLRQYAVSVDRMKREFDATRDRLERDQARKLSSEMAKSAEGLLGVLDNLDKTLSAAESGGDLATFSRGVEMVRGDLEDALDKIGIARFDATGERFDPERHQAMTTVPVTDKALDGRVVQSFAAGALIGDVVVRTATVIVGKYSATSEKPS